MVKHIIIWKISDALSEDEKNEVKKNAKESLEALCGKINGLVSVSVLTEMLPSSSGDMMLECSFESEAALKAYQTHPDHKAAADTYVRPFVQTRLCCDFEI